MITDFSWSDKHNTYFVRDGGRWRKARVGDLDHANVAPGALDRRLEYDEQDEIRDAASVVGPNFVVPATIAAVVIPIVVFVVALS